MTQSVEGVHRGLKARRKCWKGDYDQRVDWLLEARAMGGARRPARSKLSVPATLMYEVHKMVISGALVGFLAVMVQNWVITDEYNSRVRYICG